VTRSEKYYTVDPSQSVVEIEIFQGDDEDALKNIPVGRFRVDGLRATGKDLVEVLCRMSLDLDGILHVTAIEKATGKSKQITINNAFATKSEAEIAAARKRLEKLWAAREEQFALEDLEEVDAAEDFEEELEEGAEAETPGKPVLVEARPDGWEEADRLLERSRGLLGRIHQDDVEEAVGLHERIQAAIEAKDAEGLKEAVADLRELLFFLEGK
jgi:molecular chaperone DnaK (HSP70)